MASITSWTRLEPRTRDDSLSGLSARVADPLWLLSRQWQIGELDGSDNGSPIAVHVEQEDSDITHWVKGASGGRASRYPFGVPVESLAIAVSPVAGMRDRARGGQKFMALLSRSLNDAALSAQCRDALLRDHPLVRPTAKDMLAADDINSRWVDVLVARGIDGEALRKAIGSSAASPMPPALAAVAATSAPHAAAVQAAVREYRTWWDDRFSKRSSAWKPQSLSAPFRLGARSSSGAIGLLAPDHAGGVVDWSTFDLASPVSVGGTGGSSTTRTLLPTRLSFPGMPATRWWQFEDATVDMGRLDAGPADLGRLLMAEFALIYGNDFFVAPLTAKVGTISRILSVTVDTNFGDSISIPSTIDYDASVSRTSWRLFHVTPETEKVARSEGLLVIPHTSLGSLVGSAVEDVLFSVDEMANIAWAIERRVRGPAGMTVERAHVDQVNAPDAGPPATSSVTYQLSSTAPPSWLPMMATAAGTLKTVGGRDRLGALLGPGRAFVLDSGELPRHGRRVTCHAVRSRTTDGSVLTWWSWATRPGRGESSSGLLFDSLGVE